MINKNKLNLGVNVDHIATLREARGVGYPCPVEAALLAEESGADSITMHLREDRRHIQKEDIYKYSSIMKTHLNLELAITREMIEIACDLKPQDCCFVPEKREELTTEGGLDVIGQFDSIRDAYKQLANSKIRVSLFIDPDFNQIDAALETGVPVIELHTGAYADASMEREQVELKKIIDSAKYASEKGLIVHAGHGLNYENVVPVAKINEIIELNIGHSIISYASIVGLKRAIQEMIKLIINARG